MKLIDYVNGVKTFKKTEIVGTIQAIEIGLTDLLDNLSKIEAEVPAVNDIAEQWVVTKSILTAGRRAGLPANMKFLTIAIGNARAGLTLAKELTVRVNKYHQNIWDGKAMTIRQANILNLVEHLSFWMNYTNQLLSVMLTMNTHNTTPEAQLSKADFRWVNGTREFYSNFNIELAKGARDILKRLDDTPDLDADEVTVDVIESTGGPKKAEMMGFGIHTLNPLFWFESAKSKLSLRRIEGMRDQNEMLAMKINQAANKKNGVDDAALDRQIEVYQEKIILNLNKIEEIEKAYA